MDRKILTILSVMFAAPALALADLCSDIESQYLQLINSEQQLANDAISFSSSSDEQTAIWNTFLIRKSLLEAEMTATLQASGCIDNTTGGGDTGTGGGDDPIIVVEDPLPGDDTGGNDGNSGGNDDDGGFDDPGMDDGGDDMSGGSDSASCDALKAEIREEARRLAQESGRGFSASAKYVRARKAEIVQVCGNFGRGRSHVGGNDRHHDNDGNSNVSSPAHKEHKKSHEDKVKEVRNSNSAIVNIVDCDRPGFSKREKRGGRSHHVSNRGGRGHGRGR